MKKLFFTLALGLLLFAVPNVSNAQSFDDPSEVVTKYLDAVKENNVDEAVKYVEDDRYVNLENQKQDYKILFSENKLINYEIISDSTTLVNTKLTFANGGISEVPFVVSGDKVKITLDSLENQNYQVVKEEVNPIKNVTPFANNHTYTSWNFSSRAEGSVFYGSSTFSFSGQSSVNMPLTQWLTGTSETPVITYAIVNKHWYGDDVWGNAQVSGTYKNWGEFKITGKSSSVSGAQMRFSTKSLTGRATYSGYGSIY
jgi:hypothetical protein